MKKLVVTSALMAMFVAAMAPGIFAENNMRWSAVGVKAGVNIADLTGKDVRSADARAGFIGGAYATYSINDTWAIQPEILYSMDGAKYESAESAEQTRTTTKLSYIDIPVLAKLSFQTDTHLKPNVFAGPIVGFRTSAKSQLAGGAQYDIKDNVKKTDWGVAIGAGLGWSLSRGMLTLDAQLDQGLSKVDNSPQKLSIRNTGVAIMAGFAF